MREVKVAPIMAFFSKLEDPRVEVNKLYPLEEVVAITILAVMANAKGWEDIELYGQAKAGWLGRHRAVWTGKSGMAGKVSEIGTRDTET